MNKLELIIFSLSILILLLEKNIYLYLLTTLIFIDILRYKFNKTKRNNNNDNNNKEYYLHLSSNGDKIFSNLIILGLLGLTLIAGQQFIALNYWKNALVDNTLSKLIIFIIVILLYFTFGPDGYVYDISFFKYYFYPSKNNITYGLLKKIKSIPPSDISTYNNFELYRLFENLLITHERLNYELIRIQGRIMFFIISAIGIIIFSKKWFIKILISSYFVQRYIISKRIDAIQNKRKEFTNKQHDIFKGLNYIFSDIENFILYQDSNHNKKVTDLILKENDLDMSMRKIERIPATILRIWTFFVYSVIAIKIFYLTSLDISSKSAIKYAAKLAIGAINVGWIGMNLSNIYQSVTEISLRLGTYKSLSSKISVKKRNTFIDNFNSFIKIINKELFLFDIEINKDILHIKGKSGKGKTTLLNAIFYNNQEMRAISVYLKQLSNLDMKNNTPLRIVKGFNTVDSDEMGKKALEIVENKLPILESIKQLSGGERQRLLIGSAIYKILINKNIKYLILDEGDTNIDSISYTNILKNVLNNFNIKIIFTTHKDDLYTTLDDRFKKRIQKLDISDKV